MSALTFTLKAQPKFTLDVSPLIPDNLEGNSLTKIKNLKLVYGKESRKSRRVIFC